jgi:hypothetical protein
MKSKPVFQPKQGARVAPVRRVRFAPEPLLPAGWWAWLPVAPAPARVWRRRGGWLCALAPVELALVIAGVRFWHTLVSPALALGVFEDALAVCSWQALLGLALCKQRAGYWVLFLLGTGALIGLAFWPLAR